MPNVADGSITDVVHGDVDLDDKIMIIVDGALREISTEELAQITPFQTGQTRWVESNSLRVPVGGTAAFSVTAGGVVPAWLLDGAGATETLQNGFGVPDNWLTMAVDVHWCNDGAGAGDVRFSTEHLVIGAGGDYSAARTTTLLTVTAGAQNIKKVSTLVNPVSLTGARAGILRITRLSADAADTLANDIAIVGVMLRRIT